MRDEDIKKAERNRREEMEQETVDIETVRKEKGELLDLKEILRQTSSTLAPVVTLIANQISNSDGKLAILQTDASDAQTEFDQMIEQLHSSKKKSEESLTDLNANIATAVQSIRGENKQFLGLDEEVEHLTREFSDRRNDCHRLEGSRKRFHFPSSNVFLKHFQVEDSIFMIFYAWPSIL